MEWFLIRHAETQEALAMVYCAQKMNSANVGNMIILMYTELRHRTPLSLKFEQVTEVEWDINEAFGLYPRYEVIKRGMSDGQGMPAAEMQLLSYGISRHS